MHSSNFLRRLRLVYKDESNCFCICDDLRRPGHSAAAVADLLPGGGGEPLIAGCDIVEVIPDRAKLDHDFPPLNKTETSKGYN